MSGNPLARARCESKIMPATNGLHPTNPMRSPGREPRRRDPGAGQVGDRTQTGEPAASPVLPGCPHAPLEVLHPVDDAKVVVAVFAHRRRCHGTIGDRDAPWKRKSASVDPRPQVADIMPGCPVRLDEVDRNGPILDVHMQRAARGEVRDQHRRFPIARDAGGDALIPRAVGGKGPPGGSDRRRNTDGSQGQDGGEKAGVGHGAGIWLADWRRAPSESGEPPVVIVGWPEGKT